MRHFGNSLSYEEIIEDMKIVDKEVIYIGTQVQTKNFGNYTGGKFVSTNTKQITSVYKIVFRSGKYHLISDDDSEIHSVVRLPLLPQVWMQQSHRTGHSVRS